MREVASVVTLLCADAALARAAAPPADERTAAVPVRVIDAVLWGVATTLAARAVGGSTRLDVHLEGCRNSFTPRLLPQQRDAERGIGAQQTPGTLRALGALAGSALDGEAWIERAHSRRGGRRRGVELLRSHRVYPGAKEFASALWTLLNKGSAMRAELRVHAVQLYRALFGGYAPFNRVRPPLSPPLRARVGARSHQGSAGSPSGASPVLLRSLAPLPRPHTTAERGRETPSR